MALLDRPLLNISPNSFAVRFASMEHLLWEWCFDVDLVECGNSQRLELPVVAAGVYRSRRPVENTLYDAPLPHAQEGACALRLPKVNVDETGRVTADVTLASQHRVNAGYAEMVCLQVMLPTRQVELFATVREGAAMAGGECKLQTLPQALPAEVIAELRRVQGQSLRNCRFRTVALRGTACDLYSLAVLAVRTFLVGREISLPDAMDHIESLARAVAQLKMTGSAASLVAEAFRQDSRWMEVLGPGRASTVSLTPAAAAAAVPWPLWYGVLAMILRMLPGRGGLSALGDYSEGTVEQALAVYDEVETGWAMVLSKSQSLMVGDAGMNQEVMKVVDQLRSQMVVTVSAGASGTAPAQGGPTAPKMTAEKSVFRT